MNASKLLVFFWILLPKMVYLQTQTDNDNIARLLSASQKALFNDNEKAYRNAQAALILAQKSKDTANIIHAFRIMGVTKWQESKFDSAMYYYNQALKFAEIKKDVAGKAGIFLNIGALHLHRKYYQEAIPVFQDAGILYASINDSSGLSKVYNNLGFAYKKTNRLDSALQYYQKSLTIKIPLADSLGIASTKANLANLYFELYADIDKAISLNLEALAYFESVDNFWEVTASYITIGQYYVKQKQFEKAKLYLDRAVDISKQQHYNDKLRNAYSSLEAFYLLKSDYKKAWFYKTEATKLELLALEEERNKAFAELEVAFETDRIKQKNQILMQQKDLSEIKLKTRANIIMVLTGAIAVVLLLLLILFVKSRELKRSLKKLVDRNLEIVDSQEEMRQLSETLSSHAREEIKYHSSALTDSLSKDILDRIITAFETEKVYRDADLSIIKFAETINTNKTYVSQIINEVYKMNFNSFINQKRINEALALLSNPDNKTYTIAYISTMVGFKSISVFNKAFKTETGVTPSFYLKTILEKNAFPSDLTETPDE
jgi:AraC-like DNA-binding protein/Tfp pilus assembly protein PilF